MSRVCPVLKKYRISEGKTGIDYDAITERLEIYDGSVAKICTEHCPFPECVEVIKDAKKVGK